MAAYGSCTIGGRIRGGGGAAGGTEGSRGTGGWTPGATGGNRGCWEKSFGGYGTHGGGGGSGSLPPLDPEGKSFKCSNVVYFVSYYSCQNHNIS